MFHYIFGMDTNNVRNLTRMQPKGSRAKVRLFGEVDDGKPIADSYYTGDFEATYRQIERYSRSLSQRTRTHLIATHGRTRERILHFETVYNTARNTQLYT